MKLFLTTDIRKYLAELEEFFYTLTLEDSDWNAIDAITDKYFGTDIRETEKDKITEEIAIIWGIEDVQSVRPNLSDEQASQVLQRLKKNHDANLGINWEVIEIVADILFPEITDSTTQEVTV